MANSLINGSEAADDAASEAPAEVIPTWGYKGGESKLFNLKPGEDLPSGWADSPASEKPKPKRSKAKPETDDNTDA